MQSHVTKDAIWRVDFLLHGFRHFAFKTSSFLSFASSFCFKATTRARHGSAPPRVYRVVRIAHHRGGIGTTRVATWVDTGTRRTCRLEACPRRYGREGAQIGEI